MPALTLKHHGDLTVGAGHPRSLLPCVLTGCSFPWMVSFWWEGLGAALSVGIQIAIYGTTPAQFRERCGRGGGKMARASGPEMLLCDWVSKEWEGRCTRDTSTVWLPEEALKNNINIETLAWQRGGSLGPTLRLGTTGNEEMLRAEEMVFCGDEPPIGDSVLVSQSWNSIYTNNIIQAVQGVCIYSGSGGRAQQWLLRKKRMWFRAGTRDSAYVGGVRRRIEKEKT